MGAIEAQAIGMPAKNIAPAKKSVRAKRTVREHDPSRGKDIPPQPVIAAAPEPPNPAILALQEDIVGLVRQRRAAMDLVEASMRILLGAQAQSSAAQSEVDVAKQSLSQLEQEVQYRMSLIAQMKGEPVQQVAHQYIPLPNEYPNGFGVTVPAGVGSIPQPAPSFSHDTQQGGRRVREESAIGVRAAI